MENQAEATAVHSFEMSLPQIVRQMGVFVNIPVLEDRPWNRNGLALLKPSCSRLGQQ